MLTTKEGLVIYSNDVYDMQYIIDILENDVEGFIVSFKDCMFLVKKDLAKKLLNLKKDRLFKIADYLIPFYCYSNEIRIAALRRPEYRGLVETFSLYKESDCNLLQGKLDCWFFWENLKNDKIFYLDEPITDNDKNPFEEEEG